MLPFLANRSQCELGHLSSRFSRIHHWRAVPKQSVDQRGKHGSPHAALAPAGWVVVRCRCVARLRHVVHVPARPLPPPRSPAHSAPQPEPPQARASVLFRVTSRARSWSGMAAGPPPQWLPPPPRRRCLQGGPSTRQIEQYTLVKKGNFFTFSKKALFVPPWSVKKSLLNPLQYIPGINFSAILCNPPQFFPHFF